jgi:ADP-heptose:LPS heptosyltransferase
VVVHAGASRDFNRWPLEKFAGVAARLARTHEVVWVERPETAGAVLPPEVRRVPSGTLRDLASLLASADLFCGNNSGPMHLAIALGRPGVVVVGPSARGWDPHWHRERWDLLRHPRLPCQPCELPNKMTLACANLAEPMACFRYWSVDAVEDACRRMLARGLN